MTNAGGDIRSEAQRTAETPAKAGEAPIVRDDRILPEVRWISAVVVVVLLIAAVMLYFFPDKTTELFAWTIRPTMSALIMGAGYGAGAYYFARVFLGPKWHRVGLYFPAIATFTSVLGIATILYWDKFDGPSVSFYAWVLLYWSTPFLLPILWLRNRRTDPGTPDPNDVVVPRPVRIATGIAGAGLLGVAAMLILLPAVAIDVWPWPLTPATSLSIGGWLSAPGVFYILAMFEPRWSAWRIVLQHQLLAVGLILLAAIRAWGEFDTHKPSTWLFVVGMSGFWLGIATLLLTMDPRRARGAAQRRA
jgi:hypothetical protein